MRNFTDILICPKCGAALSCAEHSFICENGHCFDQSKEGYINLLLANMKKTKMPGDDKLMVMARKNFLDKDYYKALKLKIFEIIAELNPEVVLDAGCGTGYYTSGLDNKYNVIGVDISKFAVQIASKHNKNNTYIVASIFNLPIKDSSVDLILNVFAPKPQAEFKRVLSANGAIIEVVPAEEHLKELKQVVYQDSFKKNVEKFAFNQFKLADTQRISYNVNIDNTDDLLNLIKMTPYWYKGGERNSQLVQNAKLSSITLDFIINIWKKIKTAEAVFLIFQS